MKINFYLRDKHAKTETSIIMFATHPNGRLKYYTGEYVKPGSWDPDKQVTKKNAATNSKLREIVKALEEAENKLIKNGTRVANESLTAALLFQLKRDEQK